MNTCVLTGNLGQDPDVKYSSQGEPISSFNLAVKSGKDKTTWIKIVAFKRLAEVCETHLHKGAKVLVQGTLDMDRWETDAGDKRTTYKVLANSVEFLKTDGRGFGNKTNQSNNTSNEQADDEDLPF